MPDDRDKKQPTGLEQNDVIIAGRRIRYGITGTGPAVLLVPGNMMAMDRWVDAGYVQALSVDFTVIGVDPLGHGHSEKVDDPAEYTTDRLIDHLVGVLDALEVKRAAVWGYSRGAFMAGAAARSRPERFSHAVLGGIPLFDIAAVGQRLGMVRDEAEYDEAFSKAMRGDWAAFWSVFPVDLPAERKAWLEVNNDLRSITAATRSIRRTPMSFEVSEVPTLAYWGDDERFAEVNAEIAAGLGTSVTTATVAGDHAAAFAGVEAALAVVKPFLARTENEK